MIVRHCFIKEKSLLIISNINYISCFLKGCQLPFLYIFIYITTYISIRYKYIIK